MSLKYCKAQSSDFERINELFIEMLMTIYNTGQKSMQKRLGFLAFFHVEKANASAFRLYERLGYAIKEEQGSRYLMIKELGKTKL